MNRERTRWLWMATVLVALGVVLSLPGFFRMLATRPGMFPPDPLLPLLPALDVSVPLFLVMYAVVAVALAALWRHPQRMLRTAMAYVLLLLLRMVSMSLYTLEAPPGYIPLEDPISTLFYPDRQPFHKDLFFSGHVATVVLLGLALPGRRLRLVMHLVAAMVALAVMVQRVHWTVDVIAAPFFAVLAWWAAGQIWRRLVADDPGTDKRRFEERGGAR